MEPWLILLFVATCIWSLSTTFIAIFRILTNEFKGSRVEWILIAMVGFVGPLLWLLKGRRLIAKRKAEGS